MIGAAGCFTINDALCKWLMPAFSVGEIVAVRSFAVLVLIGGVALVSRGISSQVVFGSYRLHAIRASLLALSAMLFLSGLANMPLTNAIALSFTSPLFVVALAGPVLRERVLGKCWVAIAVGFIGTLLILDPSVKQFGWASVFPACAAMVTAITDLMTRRMSGRETSLSLVVSSAMGALALGLSTIFFGWRWGNPASLGVVGLAGLFILLSYYLTAEAFRHGPAFFVSPFRYSALIWSLIIALFVWGQTPDLIVLVGSVVLMGSGWYLSRVPWTSS